MTKEEFIQGILEAPFIFSHGLLFKSSLKMGGGEYTLFALR